MVAASDVKEGAVLRLNDRLCRVTEVVHHSGSGQMHGFILLKMKDLSTGHLHEQRLKPTDKLTDIQLSKRQMDYIYRDDESYYFMDPATYEQYGVPRAAIGSNVEKFLREGMKLAVELLEDRAISVQFPKTVELKVTLTAPGIREAQDNTMGLQHLRMVWRF